MYIYAASSPSGTSSHRRPIARKRLKLFSTVGFTAKLNSMHHIYKAPRNIKVLGEKNMSTTQPSTPTLADILNAILNAVQGILNSVVTAISQNANVIATVLVVGGLTYFAVKYGARIFRSLTEMFRGIFEEIA